MCFRETLTVVANSRIRVQCHMTKEQFLKFCAQPNVMPMVALWDALSKENRCPACSHKVNWLRHLPFDTHTEFKNRFSKEFLFHMKDTHGVPPSIVVGFIYDNLFKELCHAEF